ncbi:MAG: hypothetical protein QOD92_4237 [Acidimicrobiaceae bacterium]|jgi:hypothetical protein
MPPPTWSRRAFLASSASAAIVTACSGGKKAPAPASPAFTLISFSDLSVLPIGAPARVTFGLTDKDGVLVQNAPASSLEFAVTLDGQPFGSAITATSHAEGIPRPYFPVEFTPTKPGIYEFSSQVAGTPVRIPIQLTGAPVTVPGAGQPMIPFDTPTTTDRRGVELLCTQTPECPLHDVTLRAALAGGTPVAFLISTPAFCQVAICGPVLDVLLAASPRFPQIKMLHAEVYPSTADAQPNVLRRTPVMEAYDLFFEPVLFLARADGTIEKRIDTIFDAVELNDALTQLAG